MPGQPSGWKPRSKPCSSGYSSWAAPHSLHSRTPAFWGAGLERTDTGYGLLQAFDDDTWEEVIGVVEDVEYVRLLTQSSGVVVPADKVTRFMADWPDLRPESDTVWP